MKNFRILAINPGSTSTKVALMEGDRELMNVNVSHDAAELAKFATVPQQVPYRLETIQTILREKGVSLEGVDACVGRGGGLMALEGGTYLVDDLILDHATRGANGIQHPAQLGPLLAHTFATQLNCPAFVVNPPDVDEYQEVARYTGIAGVYRQSHLHSLNLKETAIHHAALQGEKYEEKNYIVCHIGGGISISAHHRGRMIDGNDIARGEGPMAPTRCGEIAVADVVDLCRKNGCDQTMELLTKTGGLTSHLGTSSALEVKERIRQGDRRAAAVWQAMLYQIAKYIGSMAVVLKGEVDAILLGGGMAHDQELCDYIRENCSFLGKVFVYPGELELQAMAQGAIRVLSGQEQVKKYTGQPVWNPDGEEQ